MPVYSIVFYHYRQLNSVSTLSTPFQIGILICLLDSHFRFFLLQIQKSIQTRVYLLYRYIFILYIYVYIIHKLVNTRKMEEMSLNISVLFQYWCRQDSYKSWFSTLTQFKYVIILERPFFSEITVGLI